MTAHAQLLGTGPETAVICHDCHLNQTFPRTAPARDATRAHNQAHHAYPENTLDIDQEDTPA